jgi:hypothetical protein
VDEWEKERRKLDFSETAAHFRALADIRFKLLALVPTLAGVGVGALTKADPEVSAGVGVIGWIVTFGLILYELRNTELYDAANQRLRFLEEAFQFPSSRSVTGPGGAHRERPGRDYTFFGIRIIHDRALALVYATSLGGWTFLVIDGLLRVLGAETPWVHVSIGVAFAVVVTIAIRRGFVDHDAALEKLRTLPDRKE